jgi:hypothetical protein
LRLYNREEGKRDLQEQCLQATGIGWVMAEELGLAGARAWGTWSLKMRGKVEQHVDEKGPRVEVPGSKSWPFH